MARFFSLLGIAVFAALVALLHLLESSYSPTTSTVSEYALAQYGWVMTMAFFALVSGSAILTHMLQSRPILNRVSLVGLWLWTLGTAIAGIFPTDPGGNPTSWHGVTHGVAASVALFSLYVAEVSAGLRYVRPRAIEPPSRAITASTGIVCIAIPVCVVLGVVGILPFGLVERSLIAAHLLWLSNLGFFGVSASTKSTALLWTRQGSHERRGRKTHGMRNESLGLAHRPTESGSSRSQTCRVEKNSPFPGI